MGRRLVERIVGDQNVLGRQIEPRARFRSKEFVEKLTQRTVHASGQGAAAPCRGHSRLEYGGAPARLEQMELEASRVEEQGARYFVSVSDVKRHGFLVQAVSDGA